MTQRSYQSTTHDGPSLGRLVVIVVPFVFVLATAIFNIFSFASVGTVGGELYAITSKTDQIAASNQRLREQLAQKQSLHDALDTATQAGYVPIAKLTHIDTADTKVALQMPQP